jgi:protein-S-isoprenylcysteine O-methyltransferase Ste14
MAAREFLPMTLKSRLALRFVFMPVVSGSLLFLPAGSFRFWQGWAYFIISLAFILSALGYFYRHDPQLIERRLRRGWRQETVREQKLIMKLIPAIMLIAFLLPGLDHRFGWSHTPLWLTAVAQALVLGGYLMIFWTWKSNSFAASTVRVEAGQKVISTGPYGMVRHPMYLGAAIWFLCTPLALGSYFALPVFALLIPLIIVRLLNEEKVLRQELPGYAEYCLLTRFRLVPFLW